MFLCNVIRRVQQRALITRMPRLIDHRHPSYLSRQHARIGKSDLNLLPIIPIFLTHSIWMSFFFCPWSCFSWIWKSGSLSRAGKPRGAIAAVLFLVLLLCSIIHSMHTGENLFLPTPQKRFNQINNNDHLLWALWNRLHMCKVERHKRFSITTFYPHETFHYSVWLDQTCPHFRPFEISAFTDN